MTNNRNNYLGLYVHLPFCRQICTYCDFPKRVSTLAQIDKYLEYLQREIKLHRFNVEFDTLYIGGGTPSRLSISQLTMLFETLKEIMPLDALKEFSIELNPDDITCELVELLNYYYVNRVSIGVQSLNEESLRIMGRPNIVNIAGKISLLQAAGINNINIDLMYGVCESEDPCRDIKYFASLGVTHFSVYSLILEPHTVLYYQHQKGLFTKKDEQAEAKMYQQIVKELAMLGFDQYEISNFSLPGFVSIHNQLYWQDYEYYGVGLGASSYYKNKRTTNTCHLTEYYRLLDSNTLPVDEQCHYEDLASRLDDYIMLALRTNQGLDLIHLMSFYKVDILNNEKIRELIDQETLLLNGNFLALNPIYFYLSNHFIIIIQDAIKNM